MNCSQLKHYLSGKLVPDAELEFLDHADDCEYCGTEIGKNFFNPGKIFPTTEEDKAEAAREKAHDKRVADEEFMSRCAEAAQDVADGRVKQNSEPVKHKPKLKKIHRPKRPRLSLGQLRVKLAADLARCEEQEQKLLKRKQSLQADIDALNRVEILMHKKAVSKEIAARQGELTERQAAIVEAVESNGKRPETAGEIASRLGYRPQDVGCALGRSGRFRKNIDGQWERLQ